MSHDAKETIIAILTIIAIVLGPLIALWLQRRAENHREKRQNRLWVFKTQ